MIPGCMLKRRRRSRPGASRGTALFEVLIALVVMALMMAAVPPLVISIGKAQQRTDTLDVAKAMVQSQLECVEALEYKWANESWPVVYGSIDPPGGYGIEMDAVAVDPGTHQDLAPWEDKGIQRITVTVFSRERHPDGSMKQALETSGYKVAGGDELKD